MVVYWLRHRGTAYPVHRGECIIGRSPHCFVVLSSENVSREHAIVRIQDDVLELEDLGSRNGTRVSGRLLVGVRRLVAGDVIEIGEDRIEVVHRVSRDQLSTADPGTSIEDTTGRAQKTVLELIEEIAASAADAPDREPMVKAIHGLVDTLLQSTERSGRTLSRAETIRLVAVARVVAGWTTDPSVQAWCRQVSTAVGEN